MDIDVTAGTGVRPRSACALWFRGAGLAILVVFLAAAYWPAFRKSLHAVLRRHRRVPEPHVAWVSANADSEGVSLGALDSLRAGLAAERTQAFLVVRGNHVVYEWYAPTSGPNKRHAMTAMAKAVTGSVALLAVASDGRIALDDPAWKYIPAWKDDPVRSQIRINQLASHQSGLDDVDFFAGDSLNGWKLTYWQHPEQRFSMAINTAPILFPPGTRVGYSGVGYYALAYALATSLKDAPLHDIRSELRERIMLPLGIPDDDWRLSYGQSYTADGMTLYAIGSGATYTARAAARIGQLILDGGRWRDRWLLDSGLVARSLRPASGLLPPDSGGIVAPLLGASSGWRLNLRRTWPDVPRDALAGIGADHEVILVVPSLDLVMVRFGKALSPDPTQFEADLRDRLLDPLMHAIVGPSSRMRVLSGVIH